MRGAVLHRCAGGRMGAANGRHFRRRRHSFGARGRHFTDTLASGMAQRPAAYSAPPVHASGLTFVSTWRAKSRRTLAGVARKRSIASRASLMAATTLDFLTR